ncbi:hypothetical protein ONZ51_g6791 [Trametes cubensis]|uniref:Uncharacterized protein n=1 Tax=Trametes cubensis TaxID=1111947 RepID=A0AAD7TU26_9APHY|nr:hypothetical protein ONZ51_g6791 [Trametes cubensis]
MDDAILCHGSWFRLEPTRDGISPDEFEAEAEEERAPMMSKVLITIVAKAQELSTVWKHHSKYRLDINTHGDAPVIAIAATNYVYGRFHSIHPICYVVTVKDCPAFETVWGYWRFRRIHNGRRASSYMPQTWMRSTTTFRRVMVAPAAQPPRWIARHPKIILCLDTARIAAITQGPYMSSVYVRYVGSEDVWARHASSSRGSQYVGASSSDIAGEALI